MTRRPWIPLVAAALVVLAACGSDGPSTAGIGGSTTAGTVPAATVAPAGSGTGSGSGSGAASSESAVTVVVPTAGDPSTTGADGSAGSAPATTGAPARPDPAWADGFGRATVTMAGQPLRVVVASTDAQRREGLRQVSTLAPFDGMLFVFDQDTRVSFVMAGTLMPLSIGFYDSAGQPVGQLGMVPCEGTDTTCPTYNIGHPFRYTLETELDRLPAGPLQI